MEILKAIFGRKNRSGKKLASEMAARVMAAMNSEAQASLVAEFAEHGVDFMQLHPTIHGAILKESVAFGRIDRCVEMFFETAEMAKNNGCACDKDVATAVKKAYEQKAQLIEPMFAAKMNEIIEEAERKVSEKLTARDHTPSDNKLSANRDGMARTIELSRQLSSEEKLKVAKSVLNKVCDLNTIVANFNHEFISQVEKKTIQADEESNSKGKPLTPGDLAMIFLYHIAEPARSPQDIPTHISVISAMNSLLQVVPEGSLSVDTVMLPLKTMTNDSDQIEEGDLENDIDEHKADGYSEVPSGMTASELITEGAIADYGEDFFCFVRLVCRDIFTMIVTAEDNLFEARGSLSEADHNDWGDDFIEEVRVIAETVRLELGGYPIHGHRCRPIAKDDYEEYGEDLIDLVTKIAYEEANMPHKYSPLR